MLRTQVLSLCLMMTFHSRQPYCLESKTKHSLMECFLMITAHTKNRAFPCTWQAPTTCPKVRPESL